MVSFEFGSYASAVGVGGEQDKERWDEKMKEEINKEENDKEEREGKEKEGRRWIKIQI